MPPPAFGSESDSGSGGLLVTLPPLRDRSGVFLGSYRTGAILQCQPNRNPRPTNPARHRDKRPVSTACRTSSTLARKSVVPSASASSRSIRSYFAACFFNCCAAAQAQSNTAFGRQPRRVDDRPPTRPRYALRKRATSSDALDTTSIQSPFRPTTVVGLHLFRLFLVYNSEHYRRIRG